MTCRLQVPLECGKSFKNPSKASVAACGLKKLSQSQMCLKLLQESEQNDGKTGIVVTHNRRRVKDQIVQDVVNRLSSKSKLSTKDFKKECASNMFSKAQIKKIGKVSDAVRALAEGENVPPKIRLNIIQSGSIKPAILLAFWRQELRYKLNTTDNIRNQMVRFKDNIIAKLKKTHGIKINDGMWAKIIDHMCQGKHTSLNKLPKDILNFTSTKPITKKTVLPDATVADHDAFEKTMKPHNKTSIAAVKPVAKEKEIKTLIPETSLTAIILSLKRYQRNRTKYAGQLEKTFRNLQFLYDFKKTSDPETTIAKLYQTFLKNKHNGKHLLSLNEVQILIEVLKARSVPYVRVKREINESNMNARMTALKKSTGWTREKLSDWFKERQKYRLKFPYVNTPVHVTKGDQALVKPDRAYEDALDILDGKRLEVEAHSSSAEYEEAVKDVSPNAKLIQLRKSVTHISMKHVNEKYPFVLGWAFYFDDLLPKRNAENALMVSTDLICRAQPDLVGVDGPWKLVKAFRPSIDEPSVTLDEAYLYKTDKDQSEGQEIFFYHKAHADVRSKIKTDMKNATLIIGHYRCGATDLKDVDHRVAVIFHRLNTKSCWHTTVLDSNPDSTSSRNFNIKRSSNIVRTCSAIFYNLGQKICDTINNMNIFTYNTKDVIGANCSGLCPHQTCFLVILALACPGTDSFTDGDQVVRYLKRFAHIQKHTMRNMLQAFVDGDMQTFCER